MFPLSQNFMAVSLLIYLFCTSCEPEIVLPVLQTQNKNNFRFTNYTKTLINKELIIKIWLIWRNHESVSNFFRYRKVLVSTTQDFQTDYEGKIWCLYIVTFVFFFLCSLAFGCILFLLGCDIWKMEDLFQRPLGPISIILNFSKKILVKAEITQLS